MKPLLSATIAALLGLAHAQESRAVDPPWGARVRLLDDDGRAVPGVVVHARFACATPYSEAARADFEARSDASGIASFETFPPEEPVVFEVALEPWVPTRSGVVLPHPPADGPPPPTDILLTRGRTARIAAQDAFGAPIEDAEIRILPLVEPRLARAGHTDPVPDRGSIRSGRTGPDGVLKFDQLPAELLTVEVRGPLFETRMVAVDLRAAPLAQCVVRTERDPQPPGPSMPWLPSVAGAFTIAEAAGLPVFIAMTMDGERANDRIAEQHFKDPEVIRVAEIVPCLVASVFGEGGLHAPGVPHAEENGACSRYGSIPCEAHQAIEAFARRSYLGGVDEFQVPLMLLVTPGGRELVHRTYYLTERELRWSILRALRLVDSDAAAWLATRRLQPLFRALCSESDTEERRAAVSVVGELVNSGDEYALGLLQESPLLDMPAPVRLALIDTLILQACDDPARAFRGFLRDPEPAIRLRAWQRLRSVASRLDPAAVVPILAGQEDDDGVLAVALRALRVEDQTTAVLVHDADVGDRFLIVEMLLATLDAASIRGIDTLLDRFGTEARNRILRTMAFLPEDESAQRRLFGHAASPETNAVAAMRALAVAAERFDDRARDLFLQQAQAPNPLVRQEAVTQLGSHRVPEAAPVLVTALTDPVEPVRIAAAIGLWRLGDRRGARTMVDALDDVEFGATILELFRDAYVEPGPSDADGWRKWLREAGILTE